MYTIPNKYPTITYNQFGIIVNPIQPTIEIIFYDATVKVVTINMAKQLIADLQKTVDDFERPKQINKEPF